MRVFYEEAGIVLAQADGTTRTLLVRWDDLGPHDYIRPCCEAQIREVQGGARFLILDTSESTGAISQDDQAWLGESLFPRLAEAGLEAIVTVVPRNAMAKLSSRGWARTASPFGFDMFEAASEEDALGLIGTQAAAA